MLRAAESEAPCMVVLEHVIDYAYLRIHSQIKLCTWIHRKNQR